MPKSGKKKTQTLRRLRQRLKRSPPDPSPADVVSRLVATSTSYSGALPPPTMLEQYEALLPGAADRILVMAEKQSDHRQSIEKEVVGGDSKRSFLGLASGLVVTLGGLAAAVYFAYLDHPWAGVTIAGADLVALASVFVYGTRSRRAEREDKKASIPARLR